jgi:hypothetical protein
MFLTLSLFLLFVVIALTMKVRDQEKTIKAVQRVAIVAQEREEERVTREFQRLDSRNSWGLGPGAEARSSEGSRNHVRGSAG